MEILTSALYEKQLKEILNLIAQNDLESAKNFKIYLDTIISNIQTKEQKYKRSIYFDDENFKDILFQGCTIVFFVDKSNTRYIILGITYKS